MIESVPSTKSQKLVEVQQSNNVKKQQKEWIHIYRGVHVKLFFFSYEIKNDSSTLYQFTEQSARCTVNPITGPVYWGI